MSQAHDGGIVIFSGGSAANCFVDELNSLASARNCLLTYAVAISDNGGSSSELIRVFGGPSVGDLRSKGIILCSMRLLMAHFHADGSSLLGRLVRLIPSNHGPPEKAAIKTFFNHRLPFDGEAARLEWLDIVESRSPLWQDISTPKKEVIRSFLNLLNLEIVKRARPPHNVFNFQSASVGNLFLTGARLFCGSFEAAVYLLGNIAGVPEGVQVVPAVNSNFSHHIAAGLADGTVIVGQNAISHPSEPTALKGEDEEADISFPRNVEPDDHIEDANLPGSLPSLRQRNIAFSKAAEEPLPSRIERIWYINPYGQEMRPAANPKVLEAIRGAECLIYSIGSLYTSIIPCLILRGVGEAVLSPRVRYKILILNGSLDRETGPEPFTATDFIAAIARACHESRGEVGLPHHLEFKDYVSHVIHLEGEGTPKVNVEYLKISLGIKCLRIYGRRVEGGKGMRYDGKALTRALEAILGKRGANADRSRRMTNA